MGLEAEFLPGCTEHTTYRSDRARGLRKVKIVKRWTKRQGIGAGNFGEVWLEVEDDGSERAVKKISKSKCTLNRIDYVKELAAMAVLSKHDGIFVQLDGWFEADDCVYVAMEYFPLGDLQRYMDAPIPETQVKIIMFQLLEGLKIMHQNSFTHRDLKPQNIFVVRDSPSFWVKIGDFGITKRITRDGTYLITEIGTREYLAPEVLGYIDEETSKYTNAVDIWSLGCVCHRLLTMRPPFSRQTALALYCTGSASLALGTAQNEAVSQEAVQFVKQLMAVQPSERLTAEIALQSVWLSKIENMDFERPSNKLVHRPKQRKGKPQKTKLTTEDIFNLFLGMNAEESQEPGQRHLATAKVNAEDTEEIFKGQKQTPLEQTAPEQSRKGKEYQHSDATREEDLNPGVEPLEVSPVARRHRRRSGWEMETKSRSNSASSRASKILGDGEGRKERGRKSRSNSIASSVGNSRKIPTFTIKGVKQHPLTFIGHSKRRSSRRYEDPEEHSRTLHSKSLSKKSIESFRSRRNYESEVDGVLREAKSRKGERRSSKGDKEPDQNPPARRPWILEVIPSAESHASMSIRVNNEKARSRPKDQRRARTIEKSSRDEAQTKDRSADRLSSKDLEDDEAKRERRRKGWGLQEMAAAGIIWKSPRTVEKSSRDEAQTKDRSADRLSSKDLEDDEAKRERRRKGWELQEMAAAGIIWKSPRTVEKSSRDEAQTRDRSADRLSSKDLEDDEAKRERRRKGWELQEMAAAGIIWKSPRKRKELEEAREAARAKDMKRERERANKVEEAKENGSTKMRGKPRRFFSRIFS
ncbi:hypothetical protein OEA41_007527 [Lepraria neglecta]|uniref:non-specific serine/threonine protein kinase n=1 Tax=Lepraria neglecta TaxID=209136 RepID=A0AAE0DN62_9LECA|nr:hypothetical protein OEA41_007527 [Lepraria neglecta]